MAGVNTWLKDPSAALFDVNDPQSQSFLQQDGRPQVANMDPNIADPFMNSQGRFA